MAGDRHNLMRRCDFCFCDYAPKDRNHARAVEPRSNPSGASHGDKVALGRPAGPAPHLLWTGTRGLAGVVSHASLRKPRIWKFKFARIVWHPVTHGCSASTGHKSYGRVEAVFMMPIGRKGPYHDKVSLALYQHPGSNLSSQGEKDNAARSRN